MKLPTPNFYADVNARGGLELCSNRVRHFTSWLVATLPFHEFLRITHSLSNVCKGILHAFKYISQGLKEQLPIFVTFTLNFIKCYLFLSSRPGHKLACSQLDACTNGILPVHKRVVSLYLW